MSDDIIILRKIMSDKLLSGIILRNCDIIAMSDNISILIYRVIQKSPYTENVVFICIKQFH